ncbi:hypothetical protein [Ekhidna sp.]|uniref:hypothetical protein n=1 Tax=Ekhidna sp. TaxID=2608089 RepID=UPI003B5C8C8D
MKPVLFVFFLITASCAFSQSYVDSGIRHFNVGEYDEAMDDFEDAIGIQAMLTETAKAKIYYYRGLIWLKRAEKSRGNAEQDPLMQAYDDLTKVLSMDQDMEAQINDAYRDLSGLLMEEADDFLKQEKKADELPLKLELLDKRIEYLKLIEELGVSTLAHLYLGETNKQAGDLIFESTRKVQEMQRAGAYYNEAIRYLELARYDDPFNKGVIRTILELARRLDDAERVKEYNRLLDLAGG